MNKETRTTIPREVTRVGNASTGECKHISNKIFIGDGDVAIGCKVKRGGYVSITFGQMSETFPIGTCTLGMECAERVDYEIITDSLQSMQVVQEAVNAAVSVLQARQLKEGA